MLFFMKSSYWVKCLYIITCQNHDFCLERPPSPDHSVFTKKKISAKCIPEHQRKTSQYSYEKKKYTSM